MGRVIFTKRFRRVPKTVPSPSAGLSPSPKLVTPLRPPAFYRLIVLLKLAEVKPRSFVLPVASSFVSMFFEAVTMGLLIPLLQTLVERNVAIEDHIKVFNFITIPLPESAQVSRMKFMTFLVTVLFFTSAGKAAFEYYASIKIAKQLHGFLSRLRITLFEQYLRFGKAYYDRVPSGKLWAIIMNYTLDVAGVLPHCRSFLANVLFLVAYLFIMLSISWKLTLAAMILFPLLHYSIRWVNIELGKSAEKQTQSLNKLSHNVADTLGCIPLIKVTSMERFENDRFGRVAEDVGRLEVDIHSKLNSIGPLQEVLTLSIVLFLVQLASFIGGREAVGPGIPYLVFFLVTRRLGACFSAINSTRLGITRVASLLDEIFDVMDDRDKHIEISGTRQFERLHQAIEIRNLHFTYGTIPVLKDVSFTINRGEVTAIVGASGSGKTTILNLLQLFYDCPPGSIWVDGVDIRDLTIGSFRSRLAVVTQDVFLFADTIRTNLLYGCIKERTEKELYEVLQKATLYDFVQSLPEKLDTFVGDRGVKLSGGEKQRLIIARAMLRESEILLLDEATSSLDTTTERLIQSAIDRLVKNRTAVVIAHRLSTILAADKVVVMDKGKIIEVGSVKNLLKAKGKFYELYQAQNFAEQKVG